MKIKTITALIGFLSIVTVGSVKSIALEQTNEKLRFVGSAEGIIKDLKTGLEWVVGPDKGMNYDAAVSWVKGCNIGGSGWRMPTGDELVELRIEGDRRNGYELDPLFKDKLSPSMKVKGLEINIIIVWSSREPKMASYRNFPFSHVVLAGPDYNGPDGRAFAVRNSAR